MKAKYRFLMGARDMVLQGFADFPDSAGFRMVADGGEIVMLAPKYAAELKNDHRVDFVKLFLQVKSAIPEIRIRCAGLITEKRTSTRGYRALTLPSKVLGTQRYCEK